jgi:ribosomal protein S18 acetylase RimI-like enzyme
MTARTGQTFTLRPLARDDLPAVVAIDAATEGRSRRDYVERRLAAALREPELHAQFAACDGKGLAGFILARVLQGEFGRSEPGLRLEMVGVRDDVRGQGAGSALFGVLSDWGRRHAIRDVRTAASWQDHQMLPWLSAMRFQLAPAVVLSAPLNDEARPRMGEAPVTLARGHGPGGEIDFGGRQANDYERVAMAQPQVSAMMPDDLREIVRIDRAITGRDRGEYIKARLHETMDDSAIRVSLAARLDGAIVGFVMARADLGDYGRTEPAAVIDTIGVSPDKSKRTIGRALLAQLFPNLAALRIERVETVVDASDLALLGFFQSTGFAPSQRLAFVRRLDTGN